MLTSKGSPNLPPPLFSTSPEHDQLQSKQFCILYPTSSCCQVVCLPPDHLQGAWLTKLTRTPSLPQRPKRAGGGGRREGGRGET